MYETQTTGNLWFALPRITAPPAGVDRLAFLMMAHRGLIELKGDNGAPLITADARVDGRPAFDTAGSRAELDWIPVYAAESDRHTATLTWLTPTGERGMIGAVELTNRSNAPLDVEVVFTLRWGGTFVTTYDSEPLDGRLGLDPHGWGGGVALSWITSRTEFSVGVGCSDGGDMHLTLLDADTQTQTWAGDPTAGERRRLEPNRIAVLTLSRKQTLAPGETDTFHLFLSVAQDTKAATIDNRCMKELGYERYLATTRRRLTAMNAKLPPALARDEHLGAIARRNQFFCYFFSLGRALDTEELCPVTSRSSDYYVSAAYWDRDSLLWSFPTILDMHAETAAEMLQVAFGRQGRNIGIHSRFIDGSMYEAGFELDELCAPLVALDRYLRVTDDWSILERIAFDERVRRFERILDERRHPQVALFSTDYLPTDDLAVHPYCIYDNVLVWHAAGVLERIAEQRGDGSEARRWELLRTEVRDAIRQHGVTELDGERLFAWSTDLASHHRVYDEPPGSLLLLAWYGFCEPNDPVFAATVRWMYSERNPHYFQQADEIGCLHAPHPWVLAVANGLLIPQRREASISILRKAQMDDGIACEAFDENTGRVVTGSHFATCAGFLAHALIEAFEAKAGE